ncbi:hypothetical protein B0H17DRAFT_213241 [Mycena rosella]|uniref:Polysaccharide lyase 14 domain-containing protein n=1 Tax=Mycena rosella TaxID=1033263 RepID=A0AAD7GPC2_MYCRO|nr:hypothetical protein B0H17DRAFT_213241 [Mycena rosella]
MAFMVLLSAFALSLLCGLALSIPLPDDNSTTLPVASSAEPFLPVTQEFAAFGTALDAVNTLLLAPAQIIVGLPLLDQLTTAEDISSLYLYPSQSSSPSITAPVTTTTTEVLTDTEILTKPPTTITVSGSTVTDIVTVFIPISPPPPSSTPTAPRPSGAKAAWAAPAQMTDLSAFNISAFPGGQQNLRLVNGIPAAASASSPPLLGAFIQPSNAPPPYTAWDNASTVLQLLYPEDSSNPAGKPQGGAEFYAMPLALAPAQSVTMGYSVFFPDDFDWVKAGKLPGLFGGKMACSGGDAALDCFSTRLMWRQNGAGELYLYAAKDKQTAALCADPQSVCDSAYGFSIGRDAFKWRAGGWTTVSQTVLLNTPGKQDGGFWLYVDGRQVIHRDDVFYRDVPPASATKAKAPPKTTSTSTSDPDDGDGGDLLPLGPLLSGLLGRRTVVQEIPRDARPLLLPAPTASKEEGVRLASDSREWAVQLAPVQLGAVTDIIPTTPPVAETTTTTTLFATVTVYPTLAPGSEQTAPRTVPVGFIGIFFSTFFGGHGPAYATPRDQYVWFKDFVLVFNR